MAIFNSYVCLPELIYLYTHFASSASFSCSYLQFLSGSYNYISNMRMYGCQICFQNVIYNENRHISWHIHQFLHVLSTCFVTSRRPERWSRPPRQSCARNAASWAAAPVWRDEPVAVSGIWIGGIPSMWTNKKLWKMAIYSGFSH